MSGALPEVFVRAAYRSGDELAWTREWALQVVAFARRHSIAVLGVEVWLATTPGPTIPEPYIYAWSASERLSEEPQRFADRSTSEAQSYLEEFAWASDDRVNARREPFFNLVLEWPEP